MLKRKDLHVYIRRFIRAVFNITWNQNFRIRTLFRRFWLLSIKLPSRIQLSLISVSCWTIRVGCFQPRATLGTSFSLRYSRTFTPQAKIPETKFSVWTYEYAYYWNALLYKFYTKILKLLFYLFSLGSGRGDRKGQKTGIWPPACDTTMWYKVFFIPFSVLILLASDFNWPAVLNLDIQSSCAEINVHWHQYHQIDTVVNLLRYFRKFF